MESFRPHRGITLVELMVVLAIIMILSVIVIVSQAAFNKSFILANTTYDVALTIRSAETFGMGSRKQLGGSSANTGYGVHLTPGNSFLMFADGNPATNSSCHAKKGSVSITTVSGAPDETPGDCAYSSSGSDDTTVGTYILGNGITITRLRAKPAGSWFDTPALDVTFARPNTETYFATCTGSCSGGATWSLAQSISEACIELTSPQGGSRTIHMQKSGEISVPPGSSTCP